jgi:hypothetical protein
VSLRVCVRVCVKMFKETCTGVFIVNKLFLLSITLIEYVWDVNPTQYKRAVTALILIIWLSRLIIIKNRVTYEWNADILSWYHNLYIWIWNNLYIYNIFYAVWSIFCSKMTHIRDYLIKPFWQIPRTIGLKMLIPEC